MRKKKDREERPPFFAFRLEQAKGFRGLPWAGAVWALLALAAYHRHTQTLFWSPSYWLGGVYPFWRMPLPTFERHAGYLARITAFVALASALGRGLIRRVLRIDDFNAFETFAFGFGLGLGTISFATFLLGALQELNPPAVFTLAALLSLLAAWLNATAPARKPAAEKTSAIFSGRGCVLMAALAAFILLTEGFYALAPDTFFDAMVYHLALPNLYRLNGGIVATPTLLYSGFPMLMEWSYGFMLFFSDGIAAKLIHWACGVGVASAFLGMGLRAKRPLTGWVACVAFLGMPMTVYNIASAGVDVGSSYFTLLTVYGLSLYCGSDDEGGRNRLLVLSAVLCGLAMGIKYTNWPLLPIIVASFLFLGKPKRDSARFGIIAASLLLPWLIKNVLLYRNPIFPFLHDFIAPHSEFASGWRLLRQDAWGRDWPAMLSNHHAAWEAFLHPWFMTINGFSHADHLGPVFLMALPAFLWIRTASSESRLWVSCSLGLWLAWWLTSTMPRLFMPGLCLFSVLVGVVVEQAQDRRLLYPLLAVLAIVSLNGVSVASWTLSKTGIYDYLVGGISQDEFLSPSRELWQSSYYNAAAWINKNTPASARVLIINGGRSYYVQRPSVTSSSLDEDILAHWLKKSRTSQDLLEKFKRAGVTHVLINMAWLWGHATPDRGVAPAQLDVLEDFFNRYARLRYNDLDAVAATRWTAVYEIVPEPGRPQAVIDPLLRWYRAGGQAGLGAKGQIVLEYDKNARL